jgi:serine/threonine protein kinase
MIFIPPLPPGSLIEEYQVERVLGQGGFGTTYLCFDQKLSRHCAIKEFTPLRLAQRATNNSLQPQAGSSLQEYSSAVVTFLLEARRLASFSHPNIVRVQRFFEANNTAYFVMDYEKGVSLRGFLKGQCGVLTEQEIEAIVGPLCDALDQLHQNGLIHRDLKPDNILIQADGAPILIDFGAALDVKNSDDVAVVATDGYAPPEQFGLLQNQGPWVDVYALGATLYEILFGEIPQPSRFRLIEDHLKDARELGRGKYSDRLLTLIDRALALDFHERPANLREFRSLLKIDSDSVITKIVWDISEKATAHFLNWAPASNDLYVDEFVAFVVAFPLIDLSWRIGHGVPGTELVGKLLKAIGTDVLTECQKRMVSAGFTTFRRPLTLKTIEGRINEYAAVYLLDRDSEQWTYNFTRSRLVRNCIGNELHDKEGFSTLMEDVIDRARSRVKRNYEKEFRNVEWVYTENGWEKTIRFSATPFAN